MRLCSEGEASRSRKQQRESSDENSSVRIAVVRDQQCDSSRNVGQWLWYLAARVILNPGVSLGVRYKCSGVCRDSRCHALSVHAHSVRSVTSCTIKSTIDDANFSPTGWSPLTVPASACNRMISSKAHPPTKQQHDPTTSLALVVSP